MKIKEYISLYKNFILYLTIGLINTFVGYGVIFALMFFANYSPEKSNFLGYLVGFFVSYILNKNLNFRSKNSHLYELPKFLLSMALAYFSNLLTLIVSYRFLKIDEYLSQILAGGMYVVVGYTLSKYFVFKGAKDA